MGARWVSQDAESKNGTMDQRWKTIVEVARSLKDVSTTTEAELMAATEAAKATVCVVLTRRIQFDLDEMLVEEGNQERCEGKEKRERESHCTQRLEAGDHLLCDLCHHC